MDGPHSGTGGAVRSPSDFHHHLGAGDDLSVGAVMLDGDREAVSREETPVPAERASHQQIEGPVGRFELVSAVFHLFDVPEQLPGQVLGHRQPQGGRSPDHRRPSGLLGDDHPGVVAHQVGTGVFVGIGTAGQSGRMQTGLVRERRSSHIRAVGFQGDVHHLGDVMGDGRDLREALFVHHGNAHLQHQVGDDSGQIGVAGPLAIAVNATLNLSNPVCCGAQRRSHRASGVVMEMDSQVGSIQS